MDELISKVVDRLGLDEEVTRKALGALLAFAKDHVGEDFDFNKVLNKLAGAEGLMKEAERETPAAGEPAKPRTDTSGKSLLVQILTWILSPSVIEMIKKFLAPLLPESAMKMLESAGDGAELMGVMNKLGLSTEQGKSIVTMLVDFMKSKLDPEVVDQLVDQIPAVKSFVSSKKDD